jgi:hypothetical protein
MRHPSSVKNPSVAILKPAMIIRCCRPWNKRGYDSISLFSTLYNDRIMLSIFSTLRCLETIACFIRLIRKTSIQLALHSYIYCWWPDRARTAELHAHSSTPIFHTHKHKHKQRRKSGRWFFLATATTRLSNDFRKPVVAIVRNSPYYIRRVFPLRSPPFSPFTHSTRHTHLPYFVPSTRLSADKFLKSIHDMEERNKLWDQKFIGRRKS